MDLAELKQQWRRWVEKEIGGPEARVETATEAAIAAIGQRKNRDEVVMAARQAAVAWRPSGGAGPTSMATSPRQPASTELLPPSEPTQSIEVNERHHEAVIRGRVTGMQQRQELQGFKAVQRAYLPRYAVVWNFRVERTGTDQKPLPTVAVEMRGSGIQGFIANGDEIEVDARDYALGGILSVTEIRNITTSSIVRASALPKVSNLALVQGIRWIFLVVVLGFFIFIFYQAFTHLR